MTRRQAAIFVAVAGLSASIALATPSGHKWFPPYPVHYTVFAHTTINGMPANSFNTSILPRVQEAFLNWTSTRVACTSWRTQYDGTFTSPSNHTAQNGNDNINRVIWLGGAEWRYSNATLGLTTTLYFPNTGQIVDADMELNNNTSWDNNGSFSKYDFESVVLHEAGHFTGLDHTTNVQLAVMYPSVANGEIKRTLTTPDINDICTVYPFTDGGTAMGSQGNPCTAQNQCTGGLVCVRPTGSSGGKICTIDCTSNATACSGIAPFACLSDDRNASSKACLPPPTSADYCKFCVDGTECSSGNCIYDGQGHFWCASPCSGSSPCPSGSLCLDPATGQSCTGGSCICAPTPTAQGVLCPGQCTGTTCPTPGFACTNGTCGATGNTGDRCEIATFCKSCNICVGNATAATCRRCCAGNGMGGSCNTCANTACTAGTESCVTLSGTTDKICYPNTGVDLCMTCGGTTTCLNGLTCVGGRCHASCNPASPGTCVACQDNGGGSGTCACPGDERNEGEACGPPGVQACRTGLVCASGLCRRPCTLGNPQTCANGSTCQSVGGFAVCVPDTGGGKCAQCTSGNQCMPGLSCYQGRCYGGCNVAVTMGGPCDGRCVDVGGGSNLCACDDQLGGSGTHCGANPIAACSNGLQCIQGVCVGNCVPGMDTCPILTECKERPNMPGVFICQPIDMGTGGGAGGGGGGTLIDCTPAGSICPGTAVCTPNGDGTASCRSSSGCDPNASVSTCPSDKLCREIESKPGTYSCQSPDIGGGGPNCGCNSGAGGAMLLLAFALLRRRRE